MFTQNIRNFIETGDFDTIMEFYRSTDISELIAMPAVFVPLILIVGLLAHPKTTYLGQKLMIWIPCLVWVGTTVVILKNDVISNTGPFIMGLVSFFIIIGYLIYSQLMAND